MTRRCPCPQCTRSFLIRCFAETVITRWEDFKAGPADPIEQLSLLGGALNGLEKLLREEVPEEACAEHPPE